MTERVKCSVPGCGSTTGRWQDWICSRHWSRLTKNEKRVLARLKRLGRRYGWEAVEVRADRIWSALIRRATPPVLVHLIAPADRRHMRQTRCGMPTNRATLAVTANPIEVSCRMCRRCMAADEGRNPGP